MQVKIAGKSVDLRKTDVIKAGGEAIIFRHGDKAVKIYHQPDMKRQKKLEDFLKAGFQLGANVIAPEELAYGKTGVVGFSMRLLSDEYEPITQLCDIAYCQKYGITPKEKLKYYLQMRGDLVSYHRQGAVVGDLRDLNELIEPKGQELAWLDVDSWQFGNHPCMVGTEVYLSPELYGVDLSVRPMFRPEHDWYSYSVLLFMTLMGCHPFKGFHPDYKSLTACAKAGLTVFDPGVRYPKVALPPEVLTDELREELVARLKGQKKGEFPLEMLEEYAELLTECKSCGLWYPARESTCPGCTAKTMLEAKMAVRVAGWGLEEILKTDGLIVHCQVDGTTLWVIAGEAGQNVLYRKKLNEPAERVELMKLKPAALYGVFGGILAIVPEPKKAAPDVYLVEYENGQLKPVAATVTSKLSGARAVFGTSRKYLYRIAGGRILQSERFGAKDLAEREVVQAVPEQTWFAVDPDARDREKMVGFYRNFDKTEWFLAVTQRGDNAFQRFEIAMPQLSAGESMNDMSVRFGENTVLVLRKTNQNGVDYIRQDILDFNLGKAVFSNRFRVSERPFYDYIHGKAYSDNVLMHVTEDGIVKETIISNKWDVLSGTDKLLTGGEKLLKYGNSLLLVGNGKVMKLEKR